MKKIILFFIVTLLLSSCFSAKNDLEQAKKDLGVVNNSPEDNISDTDNTKDGSEVKSVTDGGIEEINNENKDDTSYSEDSNKPSFKIKELTTEQFIELDDLSSKVENIVDSIDITGKTLTHVDKIIVKFVNRESSYPIDNYTLGQFEPGDESFVYRAKSQFKVLDFGTNEYIFEAHSGDKVSKIQLNIYVPIEKEDDTIGSVLSDDTITYEKKLIGDEEDNIYLSLPKSVSFGDPLSVGDTITYSNINDLEIKREETGSGVVNCNNLTDYLGTRISTWYYWNTCRDIIEDKGISYYVLKLDGDTYSYEKHYVDYTHGLYGIYIVKFGIEADIENISSDIASKNEELKNQNDDFSQVETVDNLFKEIVR